MNQKLAGLMNFMKGRKNLLKVKKTFKAKVAKMISVHSSLKLMYVQNSLLRQILNAEMRQKIKG